MATRCPSQLLIVGDMLALPILSMIKNSSLDPSIINIFNHHLHFSLNSWLATSIIYFSWVWMQVCPFFWNILRWWMQIKEKTRDDSNKTQIKEKKMRPHVHVKAWKVGKISGFSYENVEIIWVLSMILIVGGARMAFALSSIINSSYTHCFLLCWMIIRRWDMVVYERKGWG